MPLSVLIVDDSVARRRAIAAAVSVWPAVGTVQHAPSGSGALRRLVEHRPDIVLVHDEMPKMDGERTLQGIRYHCPNAYAVVMVSPSRMPTARALAREAGNCGVVLKPDAGPWDSQFDAFVVELQTAIERLIGQSMLASPAAAPPQPAATISRQVPSERKQFGPPFTPASDAWREDADGGVRPTPDWSEDKYRSEDKHWSALVEWGRRHRARLGDRSALTGADASVELPRSARLRSGPTERVKGTDLPPEAVATLAGSVAALLRRPAKMELVAIGSSTGGPMALATVLAGLPKQFPLPILITQHMPPTFTKRLADRLNGCSSLEVRECVGGEPLHPGVAYIAPGGFHMLVKRRGAVPHLELCAGPPVNSCRPAVDAMLLSVASMMGAQTLAVILTGMGRDGMTGCEAIHKAGGQILAQDEATSVVWGMPGFVAKAGIADAILPLRKISDEIMTRAMAGRSLGDSSGGQWAR